MRRVLRVVAAVALASVGSAAAGEPPSRWSTPSADPIRASSLPFEVTADAPAGRLAVDVTVGYFNMLHGTWHTGVIHMELGREGLPISRDELRLLELRHPDDHIVRFDLEGWRADVRLASRIERWSVSARIPWIEVGSPNWDSISSDFHEAFGIDQNDRALFPRGDVYAYAYNGDEVLFDSRDELVGGGIGDVVLAGTRPIGRAIGAEHRVHLSLELPTGDDSSIAGSGGWDAGVGWSGTWTVGRGLLTGAAGWSWLDDGGFLGAERDSVWGVSLEYLRPLSRRLDGRVVARWDGSPLASLDAAEVAQEAFFLDLGARWTARSGRWWGLSVGENYPVFGAAPDFTLQLQTGASF